MSTPKTTKAEHYDLSDEDGERVDRKFLRSDLLLVNQAKLIQELKPGHYIVSEIIGKKKVKGQIMYNVRWRGYDPKTTTWIKPQAGYQQLIDEYEKKHGV